MTALKEQLIEKIKSYKAQLQGAQEAIAAHQRAIGDAANVIEQAKGGIGTCLWMLEELEKAENKDKEAAAAAVTDDLVGKDVPEESQCGMQVPSEQAAKE